MNLIILPTELLIREEVGPLMRSIWLDAARRFRLVNLALRRSIILPPVRNTLTPFKVSPRARPGDQDETTQISMPSFAHCSATAVHLIALGFRNGA